MNAETEPMICRSTGIRMTTTTSLLSSTFATPNRLALMKSQTSVAFSVDEALNKKLTSRGELRLSPN